ncbi:Carbonic anhydrase/acetyltransferase, isoleucine patch superfamily [Streptomyces venezuelae]|uniref:gamma carbonic anhydrase family protein n=1 Tax=Streptomyces gardneri TaxID=66892 RepID=UPI0006BDAAEB|nr:gamma carbonic anhydrase family protein [Streptomyces gardneri]ALO09383.1 Carbonic anhydrase/acetyltransferase, isoleucine patch superfamily [Streptomyces venezuelae]QPK46491.1 gamma carbonic anhydrase family protein [Streptomyces gardneri]WRK37880.1 gamma carbonic anhydrase family protein [Streptomyces venezuelae]CUM40205.1 ferripyochelin binding protein [Streptomyces venezuelae]
MLIEHEGQAPSVHPTAYVAPTATLSGDVRVAAGCRILFGAVLTAEGGPVELGEGCIVMENAVLRGTHRDPLTLGRHVMVGPMSSLAGCTVEDEVFLATGSRVFNGARIGTRSEVRINGIVHLRTVLPADATVPIGWVAVGDPARILPPNDHGEIWKVQRALDFPGYVFGLDRPAEGESLMPAVSERYGRALARHRGDRVL